MKTAQRPCVGCIYFKACGNTNRTMPCSGRVTQRQRMNASFNEQIAQDNRRSKANE